MLCPLHQILVRSFMHFHFNSDFHLNTHYLTNLIPHLPQDTLPRRTSQDQRPRPGVLEARKEDEQASLQSSLKTGPQGERKSRDSRLLTGRWHENTIVDGMHYSPKSRERRTIHILVCSSLTPSCCETCPSLSTQPSGQSTWAADPNPPAFQPRNKT